MVEEKQKIKDASVDINFKGQHEVILVSLDEIQPNDYNPNIMEENILEQLVDRMKKEGILQPLLLRKLDQPKDKIKYIIIDGENRYRAAIRAEYKQSPAIIIDKDLPEAMISTINMNKIKGQFDTIKLAEVIHALHETYSIEELEDKLGYTREEVTGLENLLDFDMDAFEDQSEDLDKVVPDEYRFEVILTAAQYEMVEGALDLASGRDTANSLVIICESYLKETHKEKQKEADKEKAVKKKDGKENKQKKKKKVKDEKKTART